MISRRSMFTGLLAAPAIIRPGLLMPVMPIKPSEPPWGSVWAEIVTYQAIKDGGRFYVLRRDGRDPDPVGMRRLMSSRFPYFEWSTAS